jgi:ribosomal protein L6P/L9E
MVIFIPLNINYIVLKTNKIGNQNYLLIYNTYCTELLKFKSLFINTHSTTIITRKGLIPNKIVIEDFFLKLNSLPNQKLKFSGKGYKIIKKGLILNLYLNTSHEQWAFFFQTIVIKTQKQKFLFINKNIFQLIKTISSILKIRPINIFTKRGLRLSKQRVLKKVGKRSA